jgi:transcriptional regulator with XRE-family HTH domain
MIRKQRDIHDFPPLQSAEAWHAKVARQIKEARTARGFSRQELAERVGTKSSTIARFEDANYRGHSLPMLERIAAGLGLRLQVELTGDGAAEAEDAAAAEWLKKNTPSNEEMLKWAERAEIPPELQNDEQEERPW